VSLCSQVLNSTTPDGGRGISDNEIESLMRQMDRDGNGKIDFEEFCRGLPQARF
jgi:Ca2+-binding EF-hand superfamily protein